MNYEQFAIWLQGFFEISNAETVNREQTQIIKDHLALLFEKKTPVRKEKIEDESSEQLKKLAEGNERRRPKDVELPTFPLYAPMPIHPGINPVICKDGTGTPLPELGTSVCGPNPCQEISLGKQFAGVDMMVDAAAHKTKTYC